jgi:protein-S-isoprenylcysteine O-methyltransferase Ste14
MPLGFLANFGPSWRIPVGVIVIVMGVALAATGRRMLTRLGTNVSPLRPTTALATDGIFRWTRNPLYGGGTLVMFGVAVASALDWLLLLILPSVLLLHFGVVKREEQYLEQKFGDRYRHYKLKVARYGLGF